MSRENAEYAKRRRAEGASYITIAREMDCSVSSAWNKANSNSVKGIYREHNRKQVTQQRCRDCGLVAQYGTKRCKDCHLANLRKPMLHDAKKIHELALALGRVPTCSEVASSGICGRSTAGLRLMELYGRDERSGYHRNQPRTLVKPLINV